MGRMDASENMVEQKKRFVDDLKILCKSEYEEIFRILKRDGASFSENYNGIFFDVNILSKDTFEKMQGYMEFCKKQRSEEMRRIQEQEEYKHILGSTDKAVKSEFNSTTKTA
jgi:hypothetical protein